MQINPYQSPSSTVSDGSESRRRQSELSLLILIGILLGIEVVGAPILLLIGTFFGLNFIGDPRWLAAICMGGFALVGAICFYRMPMFR